MVARDRIERGRLARQPRCRARSPAGAPGSTRGFLVGDAQSGTPSQGRSVHVTPFQTRSFNHLAGCLPNHCTTVPNRAPLIHAKFPQGICSIFVSLGPRISEARWTSLLACLRKVANLFCIYSAKWPFYSAIYSVSTQEGFFLGPEFSIFPARRSLVNRLLILLVFCSPSNDSLSKSQSNSSISLRLTASYFSM